MLSQNSDEETNWEHTDRDATCGVIGVVLVFILMFSVAIGFLVHNDPSGNTTCGTKANPCVQYVPVYQPWLYPVNPPEESSDG